MMYNRQCLKNSTFKRRNGELAAIQSIVNHLDNLFAIFNNRFYENSLKKPVIVVQTNGRSSNALGWCTTRKMWKNTATQEEYYEITICAEYLFRDVFEICETLLHEMVHLDNLQKGVKDVSRGNKYHNHRFKDRAQQCGLSVEAAGIYGWAYTRLTPESVAFISTLNLDQADFALTRKGAIDAVLPPLPPGTDGKPGTGDDEGKKRQSYRKYICPKCGMTVRATKDVRVKCGDCDIEMEKQSPKS
jgi:ribosomal protein S27AE